MAEAIARSAEVDEVDEVAEEMKERRFIGRDRQHDIPVDSWRKDDCREDLRPCARSSPRSSSDSLKTLDRPLGRATEPTTDRFFEDGRVWIGVCSPCDKAIRSKEQRGEAVGVFRLSGHISQTSRPSLAQCA